MTLYKTLKKGLRSDSGNCTWTVGKWKKHEGKLVMCGSGFHCSPRVIDAIRYVPPDIVAEVEVRGKHKEQKDKQVWSEMRVVKTWDWTKKDSVAMAVFAAELVLDLYEKRYPEDKRPRKAIGAAKRWLKNPTEKNRSATESAVESAWSATESAAWSAWSAVESAWSAARSVQPAAWSAAKSAARSAGEHILDQVEAWIQKQLQEKERNGQARERA